MTTVSESLAKMSASLAGLSQRAKEAEEQAAAACNETNEEIQARAARAVATAQRRHEEMKARGGGAKDDLASAWASLRVRVRDQVLKIRAKRDQKRDDHDAKAAERRAERAENNNARLLRHACSSGTIRASRRRSAGSGSSSRTDT